MINVCVTSVSHITPLPNEKVGLKRLKSSERFHVHSKHVPVNCVPTDFRKMVTIKRMFLKGKRDLWVQAQSSGIAFMGALCSHIPNPLLIPASLSMAEMASTMAVL